MLSNHRAALFVGAAMLSPTPTFAQPAAIPPVSDAHEADEEIIVQATRSRRRVQDEPVRVEIIAREEIEEKILMRPGNIATILSETGGLRVQVTSPALGAANIRVQGMDGRYTQVLADGLPLYGGQASSLGLLQIPPTDLGRVEVIKGAASALYGPAALGGVINLVSRRPGDVAESEVLANVTSGGGIDLTGYSAGPLSPGWGVSITGGYHYQQRRDLDEDGWSDVPGYRRWTIRPRAFWTGDDGASLFLTAGGMTERRRGGTERGRTVPDGRSFAQDQDTDRIDGGLVAEVPIGHAMTAQFRAAATLQDHRHRFGDVVEQDRHHTVFVEASLGREAGATSWVGGVAYQQDGFRSDTFPVFDYSYRVPGLFGQVERKFGPDLTAAASGRIDVHSRYGTQFSPRLSLLYRPGRWTVRLSGGRGFSAPSPFIEEIEDAGLARLEPLDGLQTETARNASLDIGYAIGRTEANVTLFASAMKGAARLMPFASQPGGAPDRARLINTPGTTRIRGTELLVRHRWQRFVLTASYVHVDATEPDDAGAARQRVPLTPRHSAGIVAMWEAEGTGRIGAELYYTGGQSLEDNPYRRTGRPYFELGLLGEIVLGRARLFLNAENILDIRQSRYDPLVRPSRTVEGRWTVDAWAPTEGFVLNGGVRLRLGGED